MIRNLDMTALRAFVAVVDLGGVTLAARQLNVTQSAVSMQIKRLEELLGLTLFDRSTRRMVPTPAGAQILIYARKLLVMNDEVFDRIADFRPETEILLGVPSDIVHPVIPKVLHAFSQDYPNIRLTLLSSNTITLKQQFAQNAVHLILATEMDQPVQGETMTEVPLIWLGAPGGKVWKQRPLRLAFDHKCILRSVAVSVLDDHDIPWAMVGNLTTTRAVEASVSADLAVHAALAGPEPSYAERIFHGGALPDLGLIKVNMYYTNAKPVVAALAAMIRAAYASPAVSAVA